jgi:hypothetical protein
MQAAFGAYFVLCRNVYTSESRSETHGSFTDMMLEKDGEDQLDRSCEKRSIVYVPRRKGKLLIQ